MYDLFYIAVVKCLAIMIQTLELQGLLMFPHFRHYYGLNNGHVIFELA